MKTISKFIFIASSLIFLLSLSSCKDECKNHTATSASFKIYEALGFEEKGTLVKNKDTVTTTTITFEADDISSEVQSYEWQVGTDPRVFTKKSFNLDFDKVAANSWISIRLIVKKNVDKICYPTDDGIDTLVQSFFVSPNQLTRGTFEGYCKSKPSEKFSIFIGTKIFPNNQIPTIDNFPNGCTRQALVDAHLFEPSINYREITFGTPNYKTDGQNNELRCQIPWGKGRVQADGVTLVIDYQIWEPFKKQFVKDQFIGVKK